MKRDKGGEEVVVFYQRILQEVLQSRIRPDGDATTLVWPPLLLAEL